MPFFVITAYCACTICCGPQACNLTADGHHPRVNHTAACNFLPLGTKIYIPSLHHYYTIEDRMNAKYNKRIDIYILPHKLAVKFGKRVEWVVIIKKPSAKPLAR